MSEFTKDLEKLINRYSIENESDTPDFILARYLRVALAAWNVSVKARDEWYGRINGRDWNHRADEE